LLEIEIFYYIINVFTVPLEQFNHFFIINHQFNKKKLTDPKLFNI